MWVSGFNIVLQSSHILACFCSLLHCRRDVLLLHAIKQQLKSPVELVSMNIFHYSIHKPNLETQLKHYNPIVTGKMVVLKNWASVLVWWLVLVSQIGVIVICWCLWPRKHPIPVLHPRCFMENDHISRK